MLLGCAGESTLKEPIRQWFSTPAHIKISWELFKNVHGWESKMFKAPWEMCSLGYENQCSDVTGETDAYEAVAREL